MDIAFCRIDRASKEIQYAGAHRPLYLLRKGELMEFKGDRKAIGGIPNRKRAEQAIYQPYYSLSVRRQILFLH